MQPPEVSICPVASNDMFDSRRTFFFVSDTLPFRNFTVETETTEGICCGHLGNEARLQTKMPSSCVQ